MNLQYILNENGIPVPEPKLVEWFRWMSEHQAERFVGKDQIFTPKGIITVSTIFIGVNIHFLEGPPVLWESMAFWPEGYENYQDRCTGNREQAEAMHKRMMKRVCAQLKSMK